jgi:hypothetical protein
MTAKAFLIWVNNTIPMTPQEHNFALAAWEMAKKMEREECAAIAEAACLQIGFPATDCDVVRRTRDTIAEAIRLRSNAEMTTAKRVVDCPVTGLTTGAK